jgi:hypothetical protein
VGLLGEEVDCLGEGLGALRLSEVAMKEEGAGFQETSVTTQEERGIISEGKISSWI